MDQGPGRSKYKLGLWTPFHELGPWTPYILALKLVVIKD